jgi:acetyl-CoA carboxylase biotin carboxyl carrier protein
MEYRDIKRLLDAIAGADINEFTLETTEYKLAVRRGIAELEHSGSRISPQLPAVDAQPVAQIPKAVASVPETPAGIAALDPHLIEITAPIVGTFYAAPSPDAADYVRVGDKVSRGSVLCIIEAMKLMNEIEAEVDGVITEILVRNEEPVEYGQPLFRIRPS